MKSPDREERRHARRLLRFARRLGGEVGSLTVDHFEEEPRYSPMRWEVLWHLDLRRFCKLSAREWPHSPGGLLLWRLRPRDAKTVGDLDVIVAGTLAQCCVLGTLLLHCEVRKNAIRYRFVIFSGGHDHAHAHTGRVDFVGHEVERALRAARRRGAGLRRGQGSGPKEMP